MQWEIIKNINKMMLTRSETVDQFFTSGADHLRKTHLWTYKDLFLDNNRNILLKLYCAINLHEIDF